jgi:hypothetical protein
MLKLIKRYMPPITEYRVDLYEHEGPLLRLKLQVNIPHQRWGIFENHGPLKDAEFKRLSDHHQWWSPFDQQRTAILSHVNIAVGLCKHIELLGKGC